MLQNELGADAAAILAGEQKPTVPFSCVQDIYPLNTDLCVSGESSGTGGPLDRPALTSGVCPVQKTQT